MKIENEAEDIYAQVGVTFDIGDRISVTNIAEAYDVLWEGNTNTMWNFNQLVDTHSGTGGLECYFVNKIIATDENSEIIGGHNYSGIVVSSSGCHVTLAHEIGHSFGMRDVYRTSKADKHILLHGHARFEWNVDDWNGGCMGHGISGSSYYRCGTHQESLVLRMLMDGLKDDPETGVDITYGPVHGLDGDGHDGVREIGYFDNLNHVDNPEN